MGILLGLLTALSWGSSDFLARFASRRIGSLRTTLYMQLIGLRSAHDFSALDWWLGPFVRWLRLEAVGVGRPAGVLNGISTLSLHRSFEVGKLSVVAPLSASYPALTVAISVFTGEHLTVMRAAGIALILVGVIVVVRGEVEPDNVEPDNVEPASIEPDSVSAPSPVAPKKKAASGVGAAMISAAGFGVLFWLLGNRVVPRVGFASTVWMIRLTSSALTAIVIVAMKQPIALRRKDSVSLWLLGMGVLDTGAFVLNNLGMQLEQVSIVSVLASLYGAVTVLLSTVVLREKMSRWQWLGIAAIFAGIALISR